MDDYFYIIRHLPKNICEFNQRDIDFIKSLLFIYDKDFAFDCYSSNNLHLTYKGVIYIFDIFKDNDEWYYIHNKYFTSDLVYKCDQLDGLQYTIDCIFSRKLGTYIDLDKLRNIKI